MGNSSGKLSIRALPEKWIPQFVEPTVLPQTYDDWLPGIWDLPEQLCVKPGEEKDKYYFLHWKLDTLRSCENYDVYKDAGWSFFKDHRRELNPRTWRYATRVRVPKGMIPNSNVLARGRELRSRCMSYRY
jgi:hypothetical protein